MRPIKKEFVVKIVYWDCGHPDHRHRSEEVAANCMEKERGEKRGPYVAWSNKNRKKIIQMHEAGFTLEEIRKEFGWASKEAARRCLKDSLRRKEVDDFCKSFVGPM